MGKTSTEEKKAFGDLYDPPLISDSGAVFAQSAPQRGEARLPADAAVTLALGPPRNETARFRRGGPDSVPVTQPCAPHRAVGTERGSRGLSGCLLGGLVTVVSQERAPGQGPASSAPSFSILGTSQRVVCPKVPLGATSRRCAHLRLHPVERSRLTSAGAACSVITRLPCVGGGVPFLSRRVMLHVRRTHLPRPCIPGETPGGDQPQRAAFPVLENVSRVSPCSGSPETDRRTDGPLVSGLWG